MICHLLDPIALGYSCSFVCSNFFNFFFFFKQKTASNIASGASAANAGTSSNVANTIVKRDASGNFSAGTITASVNGNAATATNATNATTATTATNATQPGGVAASQCRVTSDARL